MARIDIPQSFRDMPRWRRDGSLWLESLPGLIHAQCTRWALTISGEAAHGSNAIAIPVFRADGTFVLRLTPPGREVAEQIAALRFWNGRGTVQIIDADADAGAMLLERLALGTSLRDAPVAEAMHVLGRIMRRLAIPAPAEVPSTAAVVADRMTTMEEEWDRLGRPCDETLLRQALDIGSRLSRPASDLAVDADLHSAQALRGSREAWLVVDPVLMRGDIMFDLARVLWTRLDEMSAPADIVRHFDAVVLAAAIPRDHSRDWVFFRAVDYWLWGLTAGLTEDPQRCRRLVSAFAG
jgi:streptomycin 6-kinase